MSGMSLQKVQSGPGGPKVGHGPLFTANSLQRKEREKWTEFQRETYTQEDTSGVAHFSRPPGTPEPTAVDQEAELVARWQAALLREGYHKLTVKQHRSGLRQLFRYLSESALRPQEVAYPQAQGYLEWLDRREPRYAEWTVVGFLSAASSFYGYLKSQGVVAEDPFGQLEGPRLCRAIPRTILKEPQMQRLLEELARYDAASGSKALRRRYRAHLVAELQYSTGMRIEEVARLTVEDVDLEAGCVEIRRGKGGPGRRAFLNEYARGVLALYITRAREVVLGRINDGTRLFGASSQSLIRNMTVELHRATEHLGLGRIRSHDFRHAFAFHLLRSGADVRSIQELLGHRLLRSTEVYTRVEREDLRSVLDAYHPRKWGSHDGEAH